MEIILREETSGQEYVLTVEPPQDIRLWLPGAGDDADLEFQGTLSADLPEGSYRMLLNLPDPYPALYNRPEYSIRLANAEIWKAHTGYNDLRHTLVVAGDAVDATADVPVFTVGGVYSPDVTAPAPAPTRASAATSLSVNAVQVEATLVYDLSGTEHYFECIEGANRSSAFAMMLISFNSGSSFQWREGTLWEADHFTPGNADSAPYWVRLDRRGDIFTGYVSPDGSRSHDWAGRDRAR